LTTSLPLHFEDVADRAGRKADLSLPRCLQALARLSEVYRRNTPVEPPPSDDDDEDLSGLSEEELERMLRGG
jgi:hypothetical protein